MGPRQSILLGILIALGVFSFVHRSGLLIQETVARVGGLNYAVTRAPLQIMQLMSGAIAVRPRQNYALFVDVNHRMLNPRLVGNFQASGGSGNDIETLVGTHADCANYLSRLAQPNFLQVVPRSARGRIDVALPKTGRYCVLFSNQFSTISEKIVSGEVRLEYYEPR